MKIEIEKLRRYLNARIDLVLGTINNPKTSERRREQCKGGEREIEWLLEMIDEWEEDALDRNATPEFPDVVTE